MADKRIQGDHRLSLSLMDDVIEIDLPSLLKNYRIKEKKKKPLVYSPG